MCWVCMQVLKAALRLQGGLESWGTYYFQALVKTPQVVKVGRGFGLSFPFDCYFLWLQKSDSLVQDPFISSLINGIELVDSHLCNKPMIFEEPTWFTPDKLAVWPVDRRTSSADVDMGCIHFTPGSCLAERQAIDKQTCIMCQSDKKFHLKSEKARGECGLPH